MERRYKLLGALAIEEDGHTASIMRSAKGCALLAVLIIQGKPLSRETLADLLWQSETTAQSLTRLRILVSRVRKWAPELQVSRKELSFLATPDTSVDFTILYQALKADDLIDLNEGLALYKRDLLDGFYLQDATRFDEWLLVERENLRRRVTGAYRRLCVSYADQQAWSKGIDAAQRWLALDELDEEALRFLMQLLAASGQIGVALQQYESSRGRLWEALGVKPDPATVSLAQKLTELQREASEGLAWDVIVGVHVAPPSPDELSEPGPLPPFSTIPYQRNLDFTGRREALLHLARMLLPWPDGQDDFTRMVAITGMGGLGKTQLAVEFCYRYGRYFPGGVFWLSFADPNNVAAEVAAVGGEQGMDLYRDAGQVTLTGRVGRVLRAWQEAVPRLLIFDNCEEEKLLAEWMPVTGGCRVLLTCRRAHWSHELRVAEWPLQALSPPEGVAFLRQFAPELGADEALEIATELGYLPLALQLAGGFLQRYHLVSADRYLLQLREMGLVGHPSLQGRGISYSPTGHELNVARTFAINLEKLDPANETDAVSRQLLARTACFAPGEPIPQRLLLETVIADEENLMEVLLAEDGLMRLVELGFLEAKGREVVVMHRLLAAYTASAIEDDQALAAVENAMLQRLSKHQEQIRFLGALPFPPGHLFNITETALARSDRMAACLAMVLGRYLRENGDYEGARMYLERSLAVAETTGDISTLGRAGVLITRVLESQGYIQEALESAERAEGWLRQVIPKDPVWLAEALNRKGWVLIRRGQAEAARAAAEESRLLGEEIQNKETIANSLNLLGVIAYFVTAEYDLSTPYLEKALALLRESGDRFGEGTVLTNLGENARLQGDYEQAAEYLQASVEIAREIGNRPREMIYLNNLSAARIGLGKYDLAAATLLEVIGQSPEEWRVLSEAYCLLAEAYLGLGNLAQALEAVHHALAQGQATANPIDIGQAWRVLGRVAFQMGRSIRANQQDDTLYSATDCFEHSMAIFTEIKMERNCAFVLWNWAEYELAQGSSEKGKRMWQEARRTFKLLNLPILAARMDRAKKKSPEVSFSQP